eukprot:s2526_g16.t1
MRSLLALGKVFKLVSCGGLGRLPALYDQYRQAAKARIVSPRIKMNQATRWLRAFLKQPASTCTWELRDAGPSVSTVLSSSVLPGHDNAMPPRQSNLADAHAKFLTASTARKRSGGRGGNKEASMTPTIQQLVGLNLPEQNGHQNL